MKKGDFIHFIGIGGVSMSGIATELSRQGFKVSGSDVKDSESNSYLKEIEKFGQIQIFKGHEAENISSEVNAVVITSTVTDDNPELIKAKELNIPVLERFEVINLIVRDFENRIGVFGGAGKTTTTALTFFLFQNAGLLPSLFLGSVLMNLKSSVHLEATKKICIFETDESDASFEKMSLNAGIFMTMENDHLEHKSYNGSYEVMKGYFKSLLLKLKMQNSPICYSEDSPEVESMVQDVLGGYPFKKSFSLKNKRADFYAENFSFIYGGMSFDLFIEGELFIKNVFMPLIGEFNALNALGGFAMLSFFASKDVLKSAILTLKNFEGIDKRQVKVGKFENFDIIDDYAHSPLKIKSMLSGFSRYATEIDAGLIPICEIHKFSRLDLMYNEFLNAFNAVPFVIFMDIYAVAGYTGVRPDINEFVKQLKLKNPNLEAIYVQNENLANQLIKLIRKSEFKNKKHNFLLFFGAGNSSAIAKEMCKNLNLISCN